MQPQTPQPAMGNQDQYERDAWHWRVHYRDGGTLDEYTLEPGPNGPEWQGHAFAEWDLPRVLYVELVPQRPHLPTHAVYIDAAQGEQPVFYRHRKVGVDLTLPNAPYGHETITVLGWRRTVAGQAIIACTYWRENGEALVASDRNVGLGYPPPAPY